MVSNCLKLPKHLQGSKKKAALERFNFEIAYFTESLKKEGTSAYPRQPDSMKGFPKGLAPLAAGGILNSQAISKGICSNTVLPGIFRLYQPHPRGAGGQEVQFAAK